MHKIHVVNRFQPYRERLNETPIRQEVFRKAGPRQGDTVTESGHLLRQQDGVELYVRGARRAQETCDCQPARPSLHKSNCMQQGLPAQIGRLPQSGPAFRQSRIAHREQFVFGEPDGRRPADGAGSYADIQIDIRIERITGPDGTHKPNRQFWILSGKSRKPLQQPMAGEPRNNPHDQPVALSLAE